MIPLAIRSLIWIGLSLLACASANADSGGPHLTFNATTGQVYSHRNPFDRWYPASLTKMMTAYTVFREIEKGRVSLSSPVRISEKATREPPTKMGFPRGTILTVEGALKIILVKSANDVSTALAESVGGSVVNFANLMNRYAGEIGMDNSRFINPHGLPDFRQFSSAYDLGLLAREIYRHFPQYQGFFGLPAIRVGRRVLKNHNALLRRFPQTIGLKTGFICSGGVSIAASVQHKDEIIISIVLGEKRARVRNIRAAEFLARAIRGEADDHGHLDALKPKYPIQPPLDIGKHVCGPAARKPFVTLMYDDPAVEYFPVRNPSPFVNIEVREANVFSHNQQKMENEEIALGKAGGPDPYELLVDKEPIRLWDRDFEPVQRVVLEEGKTVIAVPTFRPQAFELSGQVN